MVVIIYRETVIMMFFGNMLKNVMIVRINFLVRLEVLMIVKRSIFWFLLMFFFVVRGGI